MNVAHQRLLEDGSEDWLAEVAMRSLLITLSDLTLFCANLCDGPKSLPGLDNKISIYRVTFVIILVIHLPLKLFLQVKLIRCVL